MLLDPCSLGLGISKSTCISRLLTPDQRLPRFPETRTRNSSILASDHKSNYNDNMPESTTNLKEAKARLSELVDRALAGETITISRRGRAVAQITASPVTRKPVDVQALRAVTQRLPRSEKDAGDTIRELRDRERY